MDLYTCLALMCLYDGIRVTTIEQYLESAPGQSVYDRSPIVWRGKHRAPGSAGWVIFTRNHSAVIVLLSKLARHDELPKTRADLLDVTDEMVFLCGSTRSSAHEGNLTDHEKEFFQSGWFNSSMSAEDNQPAVVYCPKEHAIDSVDVRIMHHMGLDPEYAGAIDPIVY